MKLRTVLRNFFHEQRWESKIATVSFEKLPSKTTPGFLETPWLGVENVKRKCAHSAAGMQETLCEQSQTVCLCVCVPPILQW